DDHELSAVGSAEEPAPDEGEPVRTLGADRDPARSRERSRVDREEDRRTLDRHVHAVARWIEYRPPWAPRERNGLNDAAFVDRDHRCSAIRSGRFAEVEAVQMTPAGVEREAVRPGPDPDLREERFVGAPEDAHSGGG